MAEAIPKVDDPARPISSQVMSGASLLLRSAGSSEKDFTNSQSLASASWR